VLAETGTRAEGERLPGSAETGTRAEGERLGGSVALGEAAGPASAND